MILRPFDIAQDKREALANLCHRQWSNWMSYLFSKCIFTSDGGLVIPPEYVERWRRQMITPYEQLSEEEQESDRKEADKFLNIIHSSSTDFQKELGQLINRYSLENHSNTADFILAEYLVGCLDLFNKTVSKRKDFIS